MSVTFHFLNVGKGNCTIIEFNSGRIGMIDIDDSRVPDEDKFVVEAKKAELTDPVSYFKGAFPDKEIFRFILTHPDMDHMSGLHRLINDEGIYIRNFWDTAHNKTFSPKDWENSPYDKRDWDIYEKIRDKKKDLTYLNLYRNQTAECCWVADGIHILSPTPELVKFANESEDDDAYNHLSYVLKVSYKGCSVLLGGDASYEAWDDIYRYYRSKNQLDVLKADVLLAPHHGSPHNIHEEALSYVNPYITIVSVAWGIEYDRDFYKKISRQTVLATKTTGDIIITINDYGSVNCNKL